ncbi:SUKH-3 domain-containing protein [Psychrobacter sp. I-STPA6b]|uniref:SUKH-3 domain-containing protein n=1 Tax=Psychrobacter sp. I-STPA6b TaxID=2585718 RepID=UPI001D0C1844|nr:SUKH-3 domain-containing protein [Psychrobacter sp. I-STPA6b]
MLSKVTEEILTKMGWFPSREIKIDKIRATLNQEKFILNDKAELFLKEFGGLSFESKDEKYCYVSFDIDYIAKTVYSGWANDVYALTIGEQMCLVGAYDNYLLEVMISESGRMYGAYDGYLTKLGETAYEGLNAIFEKKDTPNIDLILE